MTLRVPLYDAPQVAPQGAPVVRQGMLPDNGLGSVAQGLGDVAQVMERAAHEADVQRIQAELNPLQSADIERVERAKKMRGQSAIGSATVIQAEREKEAKAIRDRLSNGRQRQLWDQAVSSTGLSLRHSLSGIESHNAEQFHVETFQNKVATLTGLSASSPGQTSDFADQARATVQYEMQRRGYNPNTEEGRNMIHGAEIQAITPMYAAAFTALMKESPSGAVAMIREHQAEIDPEAFQKMLKMGEPHANAQEAEAFVTAQAPLGSEVNPEAIMTAARGKSTDTGWLKAVREIAHERAQDHAQGQHLVIEKEESSVWGLFNRKAPLSQIHTAIEALPTMDEKDKAKLRKHVDDMWEDRANPTGAGAQSRTEAQALAFGREIQNMEGLMAKTPEELEALVKRVGPTHYLQLIAIRENNKKGNGLTLHVDDLRGVAEENSAWLNPKSPLATQADNRAYILADAEVAGRRAKGEKLSKEQELAIYRRFRGPLSVPGRFFGTNEIPFALSTESDQVKAIPPAVRSRLEIILKQKKTEITPANILATHQIYQALDPEERAKVDAFIEKARKAADAADQAVGDSQAQASAAEQRARNLDRMGDR